jgi:hypothetical protein
MHIELQGSGFGSSLMGIKAGTTKDSMAHKKSKIQGKGSSVLAYEFGLLRLVLPESRQRQT